MLSYFVTGGAGFIGSHLCERLLSQGHQVTAFDNLNSGSRENLSHVIGQPGFNSLKRICLMRPV